MNRMEFMRDLRIRLSDIPESEREEAIQYYEDYLNDAGVENEQEVMEALGSPEKVAENIKAGLLGNASGEFTEAGYKNEKEDESDRVTVRETVNNNNNTILKIIVIVAACIILSPVIVPIAASAFGVIFGLIVGALGIWFGLLVAGMALGIAGFAVSILGIIRLFTSPLTGVLILGTGLLLMGIGILLTVLMVWASIKLFPPVFLGIVNLCRKPFEKRRRAE